MGGPEIAPDSATETITSAAAVAPNGVAGMVSFRAAAGAVIARVGALGAFAVGGNSAVNPAFGQATTAGNLLVAWVSAGNQLPACATAGWAQAFQGTSSGNPDIAIWYRPNCGAGEAPPAFTTFPGPGTTPMMAQLGEFSGALAVGPLDQVKGGGIPGDTIPITMDARDADFGDLILLLMGWPLAAAATASFSQTFNNGAVAVHAGDSGGAARQFHSSFTYAIVPAALAAQPLGVAAFPYDAIGQAAPAAGNLGTVTLPAVTGKRYIVAHISAALFNTGAGAAVPAVQLKDGANVIWQRFVGAPAGVGQGNGFDLAGLGIPCSTGNAVTLTFTAAVAGMGESVALGAYLT